MKKEGQESTDAFTENLLDNLREVVGREEERDIASWDTVVEPMPQAIIDEDIG